jgi:2-polyprenyl-3-methyl-5-hydroxy-6-metoxy-1,4-benzoquinol methylase
LRQSQSDDDVLRREIEYHEQLYSGFAQQHFAKPAVRALRAHLASRIVKLTGATRTSSMLSIGCGIGDTELLLAPNVQWLTGIDLSPAAIQQARADAARQQISNVTFESGTIEDLRAKGSQFDVIIAVFLLHHLPDKPLQEFPQRVKELLRPGGRFYALDPSRYRLSGAVGELLFPKLMARYQTPDERQLAPSDTAAIFEQNGFASRFEYHDFLSSPLAGLFPAWETGYRVTRVLDDVLIRLPLLRRLGSNFEIIARKL